MKKPFKCALCHQSNPHRRRDICVDCEAWLDVRGLAWCSKGRHRVDADEMERGSATCCRACRRMARRGRYNAPTEEQRTRRAKHSRAYRERNRAKRQAYDREYYARRKEHIKARARSYYHQHRERYIALNRQWRLAHPGHGAEMRRQQKIRAKLRILQSWKRAA